MIQGVVNAAYEPVVSLTTPLVGMRLLDSHNLNIDVVDGGRVVIQARE